MSDDADLERVLDDNASALYAYLARRTGDPDDAEEALNDVFLMAWRRRDKIPHDPHEAKLWLYGVAANTQRNQRRARLRRSALVRRLMSDPTTRLAQTEPEQFDQVRDAIDALPSELGELVRLHHWEGFTLVEVASILGIPAATARTRYRAARRRLRAALIGLGDSGPDAESTLKRLAAVDGHP